MTITKQKGDIAEAYVTYLLRDKGFKVLIPWGEDNRYDIVTEKNGIFKRVQVKYATPQNGTLEVRIRSCNNYSVTRYSPKDVDIIAVYAANINKVYFLPLSEIRNKSLVKLRLEPSRNNQKKFVILGTKYESRFDLFEK
ncbi:MAG: group I intron-associated PD-(D/E)XK endonuclease [Candidatus Omnitrophica bacterium]|jgi:hypothetical protein|nr:group I intron-associated PD-(D/E)XK endonuclease [Candidatus Omnitrophota bacterium]MDD3988376.1 group I intron-associated PD-(D/E)XK endonuclease [Candidatus Omnitrophota bacterium]MDD4981764.1 group I intron-associated PD-(D/E)XK endonuclease [Candidatus Omnitrophota bacterium]MDD5665035.1 group I intron-associated PD-(D/E)XK endonuclease [Candidatus Omnitrophota bacterium]